MKTHQPIFPSSELNHFQTRQNAWKWGHFFRIFRGQPNPGAVSRKQQTALPGAVSEREYLLLAAFVTTKWNELPDYPELCSQPVYSGYSCTGYRTFPDICHPRDLVVVYRFSWWRRSPQNPPAPTVLVLELRGQNTMRRTIQLGLGEKDSLRISNWTPSTREFTRSESSIYH